MNAVASSLDEKSGHSDKQPSQSRNCRRRMIKKTIISNDDRTISYDCVLSNISETGAKVKFTELFLLPPKIWLHVEIDGFEVECEKVWHRGLEMGVKFVGEKVPVAITRVQVIKPTYDSVRSNLDHEKKIEEPIGELTPSRIKTAFGKRR